MADVTVNVITAATNFDFLTMAEAKTLLNLDPLDTSQDDTLQMQISVNSAIIAELCNRTFAREKVVETWREVYDGRVFLTHWPVKQADIETVNTAGAAYYPNTDYVSHVVGYAEDAPLISSGYELEEASGKLSNVALYAAESTKWNQAVTVTYTGGFKLPEEAPLPLKYATGMLVREDRIRNIQSQVAGIRQISHKESRVSFFDPNALLIRTAGMGSAAQQSVAALLTHYMRFWV